MVVKSASRSGVASYRSRRHSSVASSTRAVLGRGHVREFYATAQALANPLAQVET